MIVEEFLPNAYVSKSSFGTSAIPTLGFTGAGPFLG
jgi:hypothetical protein